MLVLFLLLYSRFLLFPRLFFFILNLILSFGFGHFQVEHFWSHLSVYMVFIFFEVVVRLRYVVRASTPVISGILPRS